MIRHPISPRNFQIRAPIINVFSKISRTYEQQLFTNENISKVDLNSSYELYLGDHKTLNEEVFDLKNSMKFNIKPQLQGKGIIKLDAKPKLRRKSCQCQCCGGISAFELKTIDMPSNIVHDQEIKNTIKFARAVNTFNNNERPARFRQGSHLMDPAKKRGNIYGLVSGVASKIHWLFN